VVTFSYIDSGSSAGSGFARHLAAYLPLFRELTSFRLLFISPKASHFTPAKERFRAAIKELLESDVSAEVLRYFEIRRKWEDGEYIIPVTRDLEFLNEAKGPFHGEALREVVLRLAHQPAHRRRFAPQALPAET
jgi:hypothetical protein